MPLTRRQIAWRAAQDLVDGAYVNLGIGLPTLVSDFIPAEREIVLHSENGVLGVGPAPGANEIDADLTPPDAAWFEVGVDVEDQEDQESGGEQERDQCSGEEEHDSVSTSSWRVSI